MPRWKTKHWRSLSVISLTCTALFCGLHFFSQTYRLREFSTRDVLAQLGRKVPRNPDIVYLGIDSASQTLTAPTPEEIANSPALSSMKETGWPWTREVYAHIIERVMQGQPRLIVFDLMYPFERPGDDDFRAALERHRDKVVIGSNLEMVRLETEREDAAIRHDTPMHVVPTQTLIPGAADQDDRVGYVNVFPDEDGRVRRMRYETTLGEFAGQGYDPTAPPLWALTARAMQKLGYGERIPRGPEPVLFRYSQETGPRSIYEIFVEPIWQSPAYSRGQVFRDKIVFVAPEGNTQKDLIPTPLGDLAGPEVHMSLLNAALKDEFLHEPGPWADLLTILCAGALAVLVCIAVQNPVQRILSLILAAVGFGTAALLLFNTLGWFPILLSPVLALASTGTVWSAWEQAFEIRDKARIRRTLEGYVSRDVVREVLDNPESFLNTQGGARRCITVLFSDVRGFTTMTESADAERLVAQLKEYFTEMVRIVFSRDGTLDKFIGDAVMAHWGSITSHGREADACQAVGAALEMFQALERLNADWKARGMMEFKVGLGINHGEAIVGRIGSEDKHEFSAIGDPINLASRLEGATKQFHQQILLGESVAPMVREQFVIRTVGLIQVKGKTKPVDVFTALSERNDAGEPPWLARYEDGVKLYRRRAFAEAAECFHKAAALNPEDWLIGEYQRWCADYLAAPPGPDWDGVYVMTDK